MILTVDSSRRKYGKQKIKFEAVMKDSTALAREEMRIHDLSKRLREQNECVDILLLFLIFDCFDANC